MIGMLTAAQAFAPVAQAVAQHDPAAWLLHVIGLDIDGQGRAESWQFRYCLPALRLRLRFVVTICSEELPGALGVNCLHEQHMPFPAPGSTLDQLRQRRPPATFAALHAEVVALRQRVVEQDSLLAAQHAALSQLGMYEALVKHLPLGMMVLLLEQPDDLQSFRLVAANRAAKQFIGIDLEAEVGRLAAGLWCSSRPRPARE